MTPIAVVCIVTSAMLEVPVFAIAYQVMLEIHQIADLNVLSTQNVNKTWLVLTKSVNHLVDPESVVKMQNVMLSITMQFAHVSLDTEEPLTLSPAVIEVSTYIFYFRGDNFLKNDCPTI